MADAKAVHITRLIAMPTVITLAVTILPKLTMWIGWTVIVGSILGTIVAAVVRPGKQPAPAAVS